ncbi:MAG: NAD-dependent epimerase/dehydratase family protein, partial [Gemmatirosa sp.]|nr:NAD-dependent epimerase/dehydratase family protein [Gemmatirosa sp.]
MKVLVTGATGFVGRRLCARLLAGGHAVVAAVRDAGGTARVPAGAESVVVGDLAGPVDWSGAVRGAECVVHLAARVHVLHETASDAAERFRRLNVQATTALADAAARAGVRRFVFASSVKAAAEQSASPLRESDPPGPLDPYGESKLEAERALLAAHARGAVEAVIVRPPLVYG